MKQINIQDIKLDEATILRQDQKITTVYAQLDDKLKEWDRKRATLEKSDFTKQQFTKIVNVYNIIKSVIKQKEGL